MSARTARIALLTRAELAALVIAFFELTLAAWRVRTWPAQRIVAGTKFPDPDGRCSSALELATTSWAISAVARRLPWRSDCLVQAMAAQNWLRRCGLQANFEIGAARDTGGQLAAHAWVSVGNTVVAGGDISSFSRFTAVHQPD